MPRFDAEEVRDYYRAILPFYELESISSAHLTFWRRMARRAAPTRILEIGAGFGRITTALSRQAPSTGIDICIETLSRAGRSRETPSSLRTSRLPRFVAADMRFPPFGSEFDLVVAPSDPFSHLLTLADRRRALSAVARVLRPGGRFVLEALHRRRMATETPRRRVKHAKGVLSIEESWFPAGVRDLWHARYRYRDQRRGEPDRTIEASFVARAWRPADLRDLFSTCGLEIDERWGDFDGRAFRSTSPRLIILASKPGPRTGAIRIESRNASHPGPR